MTTMNNWDNQTTAVFGQTTFDAVACTPIENQIKMVIWDLDDTFWEGTLSEGPIKVVEKNLEIVINLAKRGIVSSICSKNNFSDTREKLQEIGIWDYFVFSFIEFSPKGAAVADIIDRANLRPDNVLFLDDNHINRAEAAHLLPTLMVGHPAVILPGLLDLPPAAGKLDESLSRLAKYKQLEKKKSDQAGSTLSNSEFLRNCRIVVSIDYDVDKNIERIIELINRSNQLNFTKKRLDVAEDIEKFNILLKRWDIYAGSVSVRDMYGDYGIVGFYMARKTEGIHELIHFVFSCRTINMGIEQFIYEQIGEPDLTVVEPVSNPVKFFKQVDWISTEQDSSVANSSISNERLIFIGSCDLAAVSTYCSTNCREFVNSIKDGVMTRYDDFGFLIGARNKIVESKVLGKLPSWSAQEAVELDDELSNADIVVISLSAAMKGKHIVTNDGVTIRIHPVGLGYHLDMHPEIPVFDFGEIYELDENMLSTLLEAALSRIAHLSGKAKFRVVLGASTINSTEMSKADVDLLGCYNKVAQKFAEKTNSFSFISLDELIPISEMIDDRHFTRIGYFKIATEIMRRYSQGLKQEVGDPIYSTVDVTEAVRAGKRVRRTALLGSQTGFAAQIKRRIKLSPMGGAAVSLWNLLRKPDKWRWSE